MSAVSSFEKKGSQINRPKFIEDLGFVRIAFEV